MNLKINDILAPVILIAFLLPPVGSLAQPQVEETQESSGSTTAHSAASEETIVLNGVTYVIPPPWQGHKLDPPKNLTFESFSKIPARFSVNESKIYVLAEIYPPLLSMLEEAEQNSILLQVESGYRSIWYQKKIFLRMLGEGRAFDDIVRYVAPPGYSSHMFGTAVDFYPSNWSFASLPQYTWLRENADRFNFEETYAENNRYKMPWEAWHWQFMTPLTTNKAEKKETE